MKENYKFRYTPRGVPSSLVRRSLFILFTIICLIPTTQGNINLQVNENDVKFDNVSFVKILNYIRSSSDYSFLIDDEAIHSLSNISLDMKNASVEDILKASLKNTGFWYRILNKTITLYRTNKQIKVAEFPPIKGYVVNKNNEVMVGVTVFIAGTNIAVTTNIDGKFSIIPKSKSGELHFTFVGYKKESIKYDMSDNKQLRVKMLQDIVGLEEAQIIAYGSQKKRLMTSSVSSVKSDDIKELPTHSLENLLQGHMAGVEVNNISGSPGGGGTIVAIRGYNSMFTSGEGDDRKYGTPLYVVDGVPMQAFTSPITGTNTLSDIDPSMIESIEVLKDAASAAIYGSRAANGVILITTKKGKTGRSIFSSNVSYSTSWLPLTPIITGGNAERRHRLNSLRKGISPYRNKDGEWVVPSSYEEVFNNKSGDKGALYDWFWGVENGRTSIILQDSLNPFYNNSTDWWRKQYQIGSVTNANLQASGGTEKVRYMVGIGFYKEKGIISNTGYQRANIISNLSVNATSKLSLDMRTSLTYTDRSRGPGAGSGANKIETITADPMYTSTLIYPSVENIVLQKFNIVDEKNHGYGGRLNLVLGYDIIRNLKLNISAGLNFSQQNQNIFRPSSLDKYTNFSMSEGSVGRNISLLNENTLNYKFSIRNQHNFEVLLGLSYQKDQIYLNKGYGKGGPNDHVHYVGAGWGNSSGLLEMPGGSVVSSYFYNSDLEESRMNSYFGRLTYNFREKILFESTIRRDGSSTFGENVRWATFPSLSMGWIFTEEPFLDRLYWLSFGKIRMSWGTSGNMFKQNYLAHGLISPNTGFNTLFGSGGMSPDASGGVINRDLSWEKTSQYDIGLDLSLFNHRINAKMDYYYRYTKGLLDMIPLPGDTFYHTFQWRNSAEISNEGIELELTAEILRNTSVTWRTKFNFSRNWNRFEKSYEKMDQGQYIIGKPLYQMKVYKSDGFYNDISEVPVYYTANKQKQPLHTEAIEGVFFRGTRKIIDLNGDGKINNDDMYYAESPLPIGHGGWANEIRWRNIDLNIMFTYSLGRHAIKIYDDFRIASSEESGPIYGNLDKLSFWSPQNTNSQYPLPGYYINNSVQYIGYYDCDIENVNVFRLKQITLGYNLDEKFTKKIGLRSVRFFITGENIFLLSNYSGLDPELIDITNGSDNLRSYPLPRKFTIGLTVNF